MTTLTYDLKTSAPSLAPIAGNPERLMADKAWKKQNGKGIGTWIWFGLAFLGFAKAIANLNDDSAVAKKLVTWRRFMIPMAIIMWFGLIMMALTGIFSGGAGVIAMESLPVFLQNYLNIAIFTDTILFTVLVVMGFRARNLYLKELAKS